MSTPLFVKRLAHIIEAGDKVVRMNAFGDSMEILTVVAVTRKFGYVSLDIGDGRPLWVVGNADEVFVSPVH